MPIFTSIAAAIGFATVAGGAIAGLQMHLQGKATKSAKGAAEQQQRETRASQTALLAKEKAATAEIVKAQATADVQAKATITKKRKAIARSKTIYTSPLGIGGTAQVARKVLLGQ